MCCCALGSPLSAPELWATTVESNCSRNSRRIFAIRRSASFDSFCACARSCTALIVCARDTRNRAARCPASSPARAASLSVFPAFGLKVVLLPRHFLLAHPEVRPLGIELAKFGVQPVEKTRRPASATSAASGRLLQCQGSNQAAVQYLFPPTRLASPAAQRSEPATAHRTRPQH